MAIPDHPELTWSRSHSKMLKTCTRQWYYDKMLNWQGWLDHAPERRRGAYMLKQVNSFPAFRGTIIHDIIYDAMQAIMNDQIDVDGLVAEAMRRFELAWDQSVEGRWKRAPKKCVNFYEHLYGLEHDKKQVFESTQRLAEKSFSALLQDFDFANKLRNRWTAIHTFDFSDYSSIPVFYLSGAKIHALPDFLGVCEDGSVELIDWKTGKERPVDRVQIGFYYLSAREHAFDRRVPIDDSTILKGSLVYLAEQAREVAVEENAEDLEMLRDEIRDDVAKIQGMTTPLVFGERSCLEVKDDQESEFPMTQEIGPCLFCDYLYLCREEKGLGDKAATRQWLKKQRALAAGDVVMDEDEDL